MTLTSPTQSTVDQLLPLAKELDENKVTPGVLGFVVFAVMGLAVWMLMKSMHRHMNKVDFEERPAGDGGPAQGVAAAPASSSSAPLPAQPAASGDGEPPASGT